MIVLRIFTVLFFLLLNNPQAFSSKDCHILFLEGKRGKNIKVFTESLIMNADLLRPIESLGLYPSTKRILKQNKIKYIGDLVTKTEDDILTLLHSKAYTTQIKTLLLKMDLQLGMSIDWPSDPKQIEDIINEIERRNTPSGIDPDWDEIKGIIERRNTPSGIDPDWDEIKGIIERRNTPSGINPRLG